MTKRRKFAEELQMKEERINAWEKHGLSTGQLDREYQETPRVEYEYVGE